MLRQTTRLCRRCGTRTKRGLPAERSSFIQNQRVVQRPKLAVSFSSSLVSFSSSSSSDPSDNVPLPSPSRAVVKQESASPDDEDFWRGLTEKLCRSSETEWSDDDDSSSWLHQAKETLRWWIRRRPITTEGLDKAFELWHLMVSQHQGQGKNDAEEQEDHEKKMVSQQERNNVEQDEKTTKVTTEELNSLLEYWRKALVEIVNLDEAYSPAKLLKRIETLPPSLPDEDTHTIILMGKVLADPDSFDQSALEDVVEYFNTIIKGYARLGQPEKLEVVLCRLQELYEETREPLFLPTVRSYNRHIDSYANSNNFPDALTRGQEILDALKKGIQVGGSTILYPDVYTYTNMMKAWRHSKSPDALEHVQELFHELRRRFEDDGDEACRPDATAYTRVLAAWASSGRSDAGNKAP